MIFDKILDLTAVIFFFYLPIYSVCTRYGLCISYLFPESWAPPARLCSRDGNLLLSTLEYVLLVFLLPCLLLCLFFLALIPLCLFYFLLLVLLVCFIASFLSFLISPRPHSVMFLLFYLVGVASFFFFFCHLFIHLVFSDLTLLFGVFFVLSYPLR